MKKIVAFLISFMMIFSLVSCSSDNGDDISTSFPDESTSTADESTDSEDETLTELDKSQPEYITQSFYDMNFELSKDWEVTKEEERFEGTLVVDGSVGMFYILTMDELLTDGNPDLNMMKFIYTTAFEEYVETNEKAFSLDGNQALLIDFTHKLDGVSLNGKLLWASVDSKWHVLTFVYDNNFDTSIIDDIIESIVVEENNTADTNSQSEEPSASDNNNLQSVAPDVPDNTSSQAPTPTPEPTPAPTGPTAGESNALQEAKNYLNVLSFSRQGLIDQLLYEGYSQSEATYAVDNVGADWNSQAVKTAQSYLDTLPFSRQGLIDQLIYEGFTNEQAIYGVDQTYK